MAAEVIAEQPMFGLRRQEAVYWMERLREHGACDHVEAFICPGWDYGHRTFIVPLQDLEAVAEPGEIWFDGESDRFRYSPLNKPYGTDNRKLPFPKEARA